jgi:hypothetical protein
LQSVNKSVLVSMVPEFWLRRISSANWRSLASATLAWLLCVADGPIQISEFYFLKIQFVLLPEGFIQSHRLQPMAGITICIYLHYTIIALGRKRLNQLYLHVIQLDRHTKTPHHTIIG